MQCRYCDQRLNLFKSVGGWSFCSSEHQRLYQEKESDSAFNRLLDYQKEHPQPTASPERVPTPVHAESDFLPGWTALPALKIEAAVDLPSALPVVAAGPVDQPTLYQSASWAHCSLAEMDSPDGHSEVTSVGPLRPRAIALETPAETSTVAALSLSFSSDTHGFQAVVGSGDPVNLARLEPLPRVAHTADAKAQWSLPRNGLPAGSRADAAGLSFEPQTKPCQDAVGMAGALGRRRVGINISAVLLPHQASGTLGVSAELSPILASVQNTPGPDQLATVPVRPAQRGCQTPAMHWRARQLEGTDLTRRTFANLKLDQDEGFTTVPIQRALTRAQLARTAVPPAAPASLITSKVGSHATLNRVLAAVQNASGPPVPTIHSAKPAQRKRVMPADVAAAPTFAGIKGPFIFPANLSIRASDAAIAGGISDVTKPSSLAIPLCITDTPASRFSRTIAFSRGPRKILIRVQDGDGFQNPVLFPARPGAPKRLIPAIFWHTQTRLRSTTASVGRLQERDCVFPEFQAGARATRPFSIRFTREWFHLDAPAITFDRTALRGTLEVCEWKQEAPGLAQIGPSGTSPLSLVALPEVGASRLAVRIIVNNNQFASINNPAKPCVPPLAAAGADEHKPTTAFPPSPGVGLHIRFHLSSQAVKSPNVEPMDIKSSGSALPSPSPVRVQPASVLVLPGAKGVWGTKPRASGGWSQVSACVDHSSVDCLADALRVRPVAVSALLKRYGPKLPVT